MYVVSPFAAGSKFHVCALWCFSLISNVIISNAFQFYPKPNHSTTQSSTYLHESTLLDDTFKRWLCASGCNPDLHSVRIDTVNGLRGLYANRDIGRNEIIFDIPYELALETGDSLSDGEDGMFLIGDDLDGVDGSDDWDKETVYDVYQALELINKMENDDWIWDPYICNLPEEPESGDESGLTPDFWSDDLIRELEIPWFIQEIMDRKNIVRIVAEKNGVDENELRWATWMIRSRRFTTWDRVDDPSIDDSGSLMQKVIPKQVEQIKGFLLPLIDMANHANEPNAEMKVTVNKWTRKFDETSSFALRALEPIRKDGEITISYGDGDWTCLQMMDKYGFFLEESEADEKFDWKESLDYKSYTSLEDDENELKVLLEGQEECNESRINMLSLRIRIKSLILAQ